MAEFIVPDLTTPIVAARTWNAPRLEREIPGMPRRLRLTSGSDGGYGGVPRTEWPIGKPLVASHVSSMFDAALLYSRGEWHERHRSGIPAEGCQCGIYAVADPYALTDFSYGDRIFGVVHLSGRVIPGERGWRAERATIAALVGWPMERLRRRRLVSSRGSSSRAEQNAVIEEVAGWYGIPVIYEWPALTKLEEVVSWTSDASTP